MGKVRLLGRIASPLCRRLTPRELIATELRLAFAHQGWSEARIDAVNRDACSIHTQCMAEELLLGRLDATHIDALMGFEGREHLDAALSLGRGVVLVFPHAGAIMLLIARLAFSGYPFTQVAARGFPPPERQIRADVRPTWFNRRAREAREAAEDQLPVRFHATDDPPRALYRDLAANRIVGIAFDGRGGSKFRPTPFLGRTALLATGPWRLAATTGAAMVPAFCRRNADRSHTLVLGPPAIPEASLAVGPRCERLCDEVLRGHIEPWLNRWPAHYAKWLVHCRVHAGMDDHPLFADTCRDESWRRHEGTGF